MTTSPEGRDYTQLLEAMNELLAVLASEAGEEAALRASFTAAARGFGARKALLLLVEEREPLRLRGIQTLGRLTSEQIAACERGESVPGVSPSVIQRVVATGEPELIEDPRFRNDASHTPSLEGGSFSVLCAPIRDPIREAVLAVVYFQNSGLAEAYTEADRAWLEGYVKAAGRTFGFYFSQQRQERELRDLLEGARGSDDAPEILGDSAHTQALRRTLHETFIPAMEVESPEPVLILGERGTGKDLVARYLHAYSSRCRKPLVVVNCAEITDELAASRFFGHKKGAFTGALTDEPGFFRAADGGILFLDEVAELSPRAQAHLLRVLENHRVVPVGQTREIPIDVAVVLATNRDLDEAVRQGLLRADFYDRFRALAIRLLPLRERPWDILLLLEHFRRFHESRHRKRMLGFTREALRLLIAYDWPGNVREVARACSLFVIHSKPGAWIDPALLESCVPEVLRASPNPKAAPMLGEGASMEEAMRDFQRELILSRLEQHGGSVKAARESLGLTKTTFHRYMKSLGISAGSGGIED
ncbi:MAG TPA: sigma-54-dependent Fis family transcriptional regulator [Thermoanaerobaculia bacterium]|jgi:DNA-binding NtrC family response regulator|nr:sigma-54-dependent Fis family transcriptional regulator [Thermoanaerobaculia bacterium]